MLFLREADIRADLAQQQVRSHGPDEGIVGLGNLLAHLVRDLVAMQEGDTVPVAVLGDRAEQVAERIDDGLSGVVRPFLRFRHLVVQVLEVFEHHRGVESVSLRNLVERQAVVGHEVYYGVLGILQVFGYGAVAEIEDDGERAHDAADTVADPADVPALLDHREDDGLPARVFLYHETEGRGEDLPGGRTRYGFDALAVGGQEHAHAADLPSRGEFDTGYVRWHVCIEELPRIPNLVRVGLPELCLDECGIGISMLSLERHTERLEQRIGGGCIEYGVVYRYAQRLIRYVYAEPAQGDLLVERPEETVHGPGVHQRVRIAYEVRYVVHHLYPGTQDGMDLHHIIYDLPDRFLRMPVGDRHEEVAGVCGAPVIDLVVEVDVQRRALYGLSVRADRQGPEYRGYLLVDDRLQIEAPVAHPGEDELPVGHVDVDEGIGAEGVFGRFEVGQFGGFEHIAFVFEQGAEVVEGESWKCRVRVQVQVSGTFPGDGTSALPGLEHVEEGVIGGGEVHGVYAGEHADGPLYGLIASVPLHPEGRIRPHLPFEPSCESGQQDVLLFEPVSVVQIIHGVSQFEPEVLGIPVLELSDPYGIPELPLIGEVLRLGCPVPVLQGPRRQNGPAVALL